MKAKLKSHRSSKLQQNSQIMELSNFTELSDEELEMLVGGGLTSSETSETFNTVVQDGVEKTESIYQSCWGPGSGSGSGNGSGNGSGGGGF